MKNPRGYNSITPSLTVRGGAAALDFYARAFGAKELFRMPGPGGRIGHAEFQIGESRMMMSDEFPEWGCFAPEVGKGGLFMIYVEDADAAYAKAIEAGATSVMPPTDQFWGDRSGQVADPFGYRWSVAHNVQEVLPEEMEKAAAALAEGREKRGAGE